MPAQGALCKRQVCIYAEHVLLAGAFAGLLGAQQPALTGAGSVASSWEESCQHGQHGNDDDLTCRVAGLPAAASLPSLAALSVLITLCTARCAAPTVSKLWLSSASSSDRRLMAAASAEVSVRGRKVLRSCCRLYVSSEDSGEAMQPSTAISRALLRSTSCVGWDRETGWPGAGHAYEESVEAEATDKQA